MSTLVLGLTLDLLKEGKVDRNFYRSEDVLAVLIENGYTHLGWLNAGITPPALDDWMEQYQNRSGSDTIVVSHSQKLIYCVDMGD